jgi:glycosyltransferase involved in cell wall biosynthesis
MRILIVNTFERNGGAAVAANRLMRALNKMGCEAKMLVRDKQTDDSNVMSINTNQIKGKLIFFRFAWERWVIFLNNVFRKENLFAVSIANTGNDISSHRWVRQADIIHLHWFNQGLLSLQNIQQLKSLGKPIVWTMHDMWAFSGICHYAGTCEKYKLKCEKCPLQKKKIVDLAKQTFEKKQKIVQEGIQYVGCSQWIASCAKQSALLQHSPITNIPNPIDTDLFKPKDKIQVRRRLNLPADKKLLLFAAAKLSDSRKGITYFVEACKLLQGQDVEVVFLGGNIDEELLQAVSLPSHTLGYLDTPNEISAAYGACDVFVTPSLEDNLPNTIMEAMSCGTPCVGFNTGGIPEMIGHKLNGYVAEYKNAADLANGIVFCLENYAGLSRASRQKVEASYSEELVAKRYLEIYNKLLVK